MINYYEHQKLQHFYQSYYQNSMNLLHQLLFHNRYNYTCFYRYFIFFYNSGNDVFFSIQLLNKLL